jgi:hypothetical protein
MLHTTCGGVEPRGISLRNPFTAGMDLMAINAANPIRGMSSALPMLRTFVLGMAGQTYPVRVSRGALLKSKDLGRVSSAVYVKTAVTMTIFTLNTLLSMIGVLEILCDVRVACGAGFRPDRFGPWDPEKSCEGCDTPRRLLGRRRRDANKGCKSRYHRYPQEG